MIHSILITDRSAWLDRIRNPDAADDTYVRVRWHAAIDGNPGNWGCGRSPLLAAKEACRTVGQEFPQNFTLNYSTQITQKEAGDDPFRDG